jgi:twitching motility protein PilJ
VFLLQKDLNSFKELGLGLKDGNPELKLKPTKDKGTVEQLDQLIQLFDDMRGQTKTILENLQGIVSARDAHNGLLAESEPLRKNLEILQTKLTSQAGADAWLLWTLALAALLAIAAAVGLAYLQVLDGRQRQQEAEQMAEQAQGQEVESKRVNNANQAAILRLMNELQNVADGDLTQEATVTEDITGAIADSVNYTVEELRALVGNVQKTSTQVALTTDKVEASSAQLLTVAVKQLDDIQMVEKSVTAMAERMSQTSGLADESASVARQFLAAANSGLSAVQSSMSGINTIRFKIQQTAVIPRPESPSLSARVFLSKKSVLSVKSAKAAALPVSAWVADFAKRCECSKDCPVALSCPAARSDCAKTQKILAAKTTRESAKTIISSRW